MGNLLFSPTGRVNSSEFMRGAMVLIAITFMLTALPALNAQLGAVLGLLGLVVVWCWIALFVKRYHDGNKPGWMCLIPIVIFLLLAFILSAIVTNMFAGEENLILAQMMAEGGLKAVMSKEGQELSMLVTQKAAVPKAISGAILSYAIAFVFNAMIKHDPQDNQYGPAA